MAGHIIDGERWITERLRFLRERLGRDLSDGERRAAEDEIERLRCERGLTTSGNRRFRLLRRRRRR